MEKDDPLRRPLFLSRLLVRNVSHTLIDELIKTQNVLINFEKIEEEEDTNSDKGDLGKEGP